MKSKDVVQWLTIAAMLIGGGMWLGKLQQRMDDNDSFYHGGYQIPHSQKGQ